MGRTGPPHQVCEWSRSVAASAREDLSEDWFKGSLPSGRSAAVRRSVSSTFRERIRYRVRNSTLTLLWEGPCSCVRLCLSRGLQSPSRYRRCSAEPRSPRMVRQEVLQRQRCRQYRFKNRCAGARRGAGCTHSKRRRANALAATTRRSGSIFRRQSDLVASGDARCAFGNIDAAGKFRAERAPLALATGGPA